MPIPLEASEIIVPTNRRPQTQCAPLYIHDLFKKIIVYICSVINQKIILIFKLTFTCFHQNSKSLQFPAYQFFMEVNYTMFRFELFLEFIY
jgi:hypothetical protein